MNTELFLMTLAVAVGTWTMRYLPARARPGTAAATGPLARFLRAIGPSAITAMTVSLLLPFLDGGAGALVPLLAGVLGVLGAFWWRRDVALATIAGALCYGLAFAVAG